MPTYLHAKLKLTSLAQATRNPSLGSTNAPVGRADKAPPCEGGQVGSIPTPRPSFASSFNGRTAVSEIADLGSSPSEAAISNGDIV